MGLSKSGDTEENVDFLEALRTMPPRPRKSKTGLIIIIVAMTVVAIVVCATLYVWWTGNGIVDGWTPAAAYSKTPTSGGWQIDIVSITRTDVPWDDVKVQLNDGTHSVDWGIRTADLDGGFNITAPYPAKLLGTLSVTLSVTDSSGNGFVNGGDFFTVTANPVFSSMTTYTAVLIYEDTDERIGAGITFTG